MGSVCTIAIADYPLGEIKSDPPIDWVSIFTPGDFVRTRRSLSKRNPLIWGTSNSGDDRIKENAYEYKIPAWVAKDRLDLFGYTVDAFDATYRAWHRGESATHRRINYPFLLRGVGAARARRIIGSLVQRKVVSWGRRDPQF
ncbi:MAG: HEPN/Toprim-associated domain-containing protein [Burkholderiales bacterium]